MLLEKKIELLSKKTIRERVLKFLYEVKKEQKKDIFKIPYSREQMADYICTDRSALSRELANETRKNF